MQFSCRIELISLANPRDISPPHNTVSVLPCSRICKAKVTSSAVDQYAPSADNGALGTRSGGLHTVDLQTWHLRGLSLSAAAGGPLTERLRAAGSHVCGQEVTRHLLSLKRIPPIALKGSAPRLRSHITVMMMLFSSVERASLRICIHSWSGCISK